MDRLTGLMGAREFFVSLPTLASAERGSLALFDVDDLQLMNERHGERNVDRMLVRLGSVIRERCGTGELAARVGGDEFALGLLEDDASEIVWEVEHIRRRFGEASGGVTLSVGICDTATLRRASGKLSLFEPAQELFEAAQDALVEAQEQRPAGLKIFRPPQ